MIRPARLPGDEAAILAFIRDLQIHESGMEANRRLDPHFVPDHWRALRARAENGAIFMAEEEGRAIGWALAHEVEGEIFLVSPERAYCFLAEIYVDPARRGAGHGRALIAACEEWARAQGLGVMLIGVLAANVPAIRAYEGAGYARYNLTLRKYL